MTIHAQKFSVSLPQQQCNFIEQYQMQHHYKSRSEVIKKAIYLLQQMHLEASYLEANKEIDANWEIAANDGINKDEAW